MLSKPVIETSRHRALSVAPDEQLEKVRALFRTYGVRVVAVVDDSKLVGVITRTDIVRITTTKTEAKAKDIASLPKVVLNPETPVIDALRIALSLNEWYLPIAENRRFKGFFGLEDAIQLCLSFETCSRRLEEVKVEEVMIRDYPRVKKDDPLDAIWRLLTDEGYVSIPVVDDKERIVGIVTQYDLIRKGYTRIHVEASKSPAKKPKVRSAMTRPCTFLYPYNSLKDSGTLLISRNIAGAPVVEDDSSRRMTGFISRIEVAKAIALS